MKNMLWPNPLYAFLEFIDHYQKDKRKPLEKKILDCGAGGERPPLGLFYEHGFETLGIDISDEQRSKASKFFKEQGINVSLRKGDMRQIPFSDESFSYVYEYYSLCHLTKADTAIAIKEMVRVLKPGGLCFLGFMSKDCWPIMGTETRLGEFSCIEHDDRGVHSVYSDDEPDVYFDGLDIVWKEKRITWFREAAANVSKEEWISMHKDRWTKYSKGDWIEMYDKRVHNYRYSHLFYIVRKPA